MEGCHHDSVNVRAVALSLWLVKLVWVRILLLVILAILLTFMLRLPVIDPEQQTQGADPKR